MNSLITPEWLLLKRDLLWSYCQCSSFKWVECPTKYILHKKEIIFFMFHHYFLSSAFPLHFKSGEIPSQGKMEIYKNGSWQKLCTRSWDRDEENLTCKAMGYSNDVGYANAMGHTNSTNTPQIHWFTLIVHHWRNAGLTLLTKHNYAKVNNNFCTSMTYCSYSLVQLRVLSN